MGEVYRARDPRLGRDVAIKVLPTSFAEDPDRLRRFEQEARAAGGLDHPNVLSLHDLGTEAGAPYLVFELLEGETLRRRLADGVHFPSRRIEPGQSPDRLRPVLVLTRQEVIALLHTVMVAPITSTLRGAPSEVGVGVEHGLRHPSAVNLDHVQTVKRSRLAGYVGRLGPEKMRDVCRALAIAVGCDG
jgi:mRNA-degrading endonuclease toxin of MazEF toxin-antitoxin module